ncbi:MAG TPA: hypothetical protein VGB71_18160 [Flavisolibacter sp.]|jgi:hypothetical protein
MREERIKEYIRQRLAELDKQKDMQEVIQKGKFSFGVDSQTYGHLPAWKDLVKQKKRLKKLIWIDAFLVSFTIIFITGDYAAQFAQNWAEALLKLSLLGGGIMLFYVITAFFTLFHKFRQTEREVRKLIYQDLLFQLTKEEKQAA